MRKHTPGPWQTRRALRPTDGEFDYAISALFNGHPVCIAEAFGRIAHDIIVDAEANAHLIASAPVRAAIAKITGEPS